jgi:hypothetical protein
MPVIEAFTEQAASVEGLDFYVVGVAAIPGEEADRIEGQFRGLVKQNQFLQASGRLPVTGSFMFYIKASATSFYLMNLIEPVIILA